MKKSIATNFRGFLNGPHRGPLSLELKRARVALHSGMKWRRLNMINKEITSRCQNTYDMEWKWAILSILSMGRTASAPPSTYYYIIHRGTLEPCAWWGNQQRHKLAWCMGPRDKYHKFLYKVRNIYPSFILLCCIYISWIGLICLMQERSKNLWYSSLGHF